MASYAQLAEEVRAQVDVDSDQALAWLLDRSRVLNAETAWSLVTLTIVAKDGQRAYPQPEDTLWIEAIIVGGVPYQRSTMHAMDARLSGDTWNTLGVYTDYVDTADAPGVPMFRIDPPPSQGVEVEVRYVRDLADDLVDPPFPSDFDQVLVDGAIATGLARMDERFDSAGYFDARFASAIARLRRRRHGRVGRGAVGIRIVQ